MRKVLSILLVVLVLTFALGLASCTFGGQVTDTTTTTTTTNQNPSEDDPPVDHVHTEEIIAAVESTCTEAGLTEGKKCSECGEILVAQETVPANGHTEKIVYGKAATCTETGLTNGKECTVCGETTVVQTVIAETGHKFSDWETVIKPTCANGLEEGVCGACGEKETREVPAIDEHRKGRWITDKEATCTEEGLRHLECAACGVTMQTQTIAIGVHDWVLTTIEEATCTEWGIDQYTCEDCGVNEKVSVPPHGHIGSWVVDVAATCTDKGSRHIDCTSCNTTITEVIRAKGHSWSEWIIDDEAKCAHWGKKHQNCSECGEVYSATISAYGHDFVDGICTRCGSPTPSEGLKLTLNEDGKSYSVTGIGTCTDENIVIPDIYNKLPVISIGKSAFSRVSTVNIKSVYIPDNITSIGSYAFKEVRWLKTIIIGNGLKTVGVDAFKDCYPMVSVNYSSTKSVYIKDVAAWCEIEFENYDANPLCHTHSEDGANLYLNDVLVTELVIPEGVVNIADIVFAGCDSITSVVIPDSVTNIGFEAFKGCSSLESVSFGKGLTTITSSAFSGCVSLKELTIGDNIESIGTSAFYSCKSLESLTIGGGVKTIGGGAFLGCYALASLQLSEGLEIIGDSAFSGCGNLTSLTIPRSVTQIGNGAFADTGLLESVVIPDTVLELGASVFACYSREIIIYCEAENQPDGWDVDWNWSGSYFGDKEKYCYQAVWGSKDE